MAQLTTAFVADRCIIESHGSSKAATTGRRWAVTYGTWLTAIQNHGAATLDWWTSCTLTAQ